MNKTLLLLSITTSLMSFVLASNFASKQMPQKYESFFHFDKVIYYTTDISQKDLDGLRARKKQSEKQRLFFQILEGNQPYSINDTAFLVHMKSFGYSLKKVSENKLGAIDSIFSFKGVPEDVTSTRCLPVYRDVLVFLENKKIVGIAKICFECGMAHIVGSEKDTNYFGQFGEFPALFRVLN